MKIFKLKHLATGMYYTPNKGRYGSTKSNLSKKGKIYPRIYKFSVLFGGDSGKGTYYHPTGKKYPERYYTTEKFIEAEWKWEEFNLTETEKEQ